MLINVSFVERRQKIISPEILSDVLDELRRERKILMVIQNADVDQYIAMDMTEMDIYKAKKMEDISLNVLLAC